jgi:glycosyltransferase involved in cell wall biosynthesis
MKIFQITTFFHPVTGGVESAVYSLCTELIKRGHDVTVLTSDSAKTGPRISQHQSNYNGIKVKRFFTLFSLSYYHKFYPGLFFYLLQHDFDVLHVHGFRKFETYIALFVGHLKKKKVILTTHNPFPTTSRSRLNNFFISLHDKTFGRWFVKKLDKLITLVPSETKLFEKQFGVPAKKIVTIPNGLDVKFFEPGNPEEFYKENNIDPKQWDGIVAGCGRLTYAKGFQNLRTAVKELPRVLFFIAGGDDGYLTELKSLYLKSPNIIFNEKFLPPEKLNHIFAAADVFTFPSLHEAFGIVLLEAMAQGCPVISTDRGGPAEFLTKDVGYLLDPTAEAEWKEKIGLLIGDAELRQKIGEHAKKFVRQYNWEVLAEQVEHIYIKS